MHLCSLSYFRIFFDLSLFFNPASESSERKVPEYASLKVDVFSDLGVSFTPGLFIDTAVYKSFGGGYIYCYLIVIQLI